MSLKRKLLKGSLVLVATIVAGFAVLVVAYNRSLYRSLDGPRPEIVIRGGTLFDGTGAPPRPNPGLVLGGGAIACVGRSCKAPAGALEIDASGLAILPGFIDLHGHLFGRRDEPNFFELIWDFARMRPGLRRELLEAGVTSYRSVGDPREIILEVKQLQQTRELAGPRLFVAGPIFTAPGGHPAYGGRDPAGGVGGRMTFQSNDPDEVRREVAVLARQGVDGIKAVLHGSVSKDGRVLLPTLSIETLEALAGEARSRGLWMAVHVGPGSESGQAALAGATTIEHGVRQGNVIDDRTLRALLDHDVIYVPTLVVDPDGRPSIPRLVEAGVPLGVGTDGGDYHAELALLADAGVPPAQVLVAATSNGARGLLRSDVLGTVERGKLADILLVDGEPWNDVRDARSIVTVIQDGYVVVDRR